MNNQGEEIGVEITRERLIDLLNADLAREYMAVISYTVFSQMIKGAKYVAIAKEMEKHASEELEHALKLSKQIDYFGGTPGTQPAPVRTTDKAEEMLRFDLEAEIETVRNYRERIVQAEALGEFGLAQALREIIAEEQEHQIDLATALGINVPEEGLGLPCTPQPMSAPAP